MSEQEGLLSVAKAFVDTRDKLLREMYGHAVTRVELPDGTVVEWDDTIGVGGELYTYCKMRVGPTGGSDESE